MLSVLRRTVEQEISYAALPGASKRATPVRSRPWCAAYIRLLLGVVVAAGLAASVVAGTARTVAALGAVATRTLTTLEVLALALGGTLGTSRGLGLVKTIERDLAAIVDLNDDDLDLVAHVKDILDLLHTALGDAGDV